MFTLPQQGWFVGNVPAVAMIVDHGYKKYAVYQTAKDILTKKIDFKDLRWIQNIWAT